MMCIPRWSLTLALVSLISCGGSHSETTAADSVAAAGSEVTSTVPVERESTGSAGTELATFTEADLDLYERGMAAEIQAVQAAQARLSSATTPAERSAAMQAQWDNQTIPAAANAAGIDESRYRSMRKAVHHVLETLDFQGKIEGPKSMDMARASEEMKARLASDPFTTLSPDAATALRARLDRLAKQWAEYVRLTAVAG